MDVDGGKDRLGRARRKDNGMIVDEMDWKDTHRLHRHDGKLPTCLVFCRITLVSISREGAGWGLGRNISMEDGTLQVRDQTRSHHVSNQEERRKAQTRATSTRLDGPPARHRLRLNPALEGGRPRYFGGCAAQNRASDTGKWVCGSQSAGPLPATTNPIGHATTPCAVSQVGQKTKCAEAAGREDKRLARPDALARRLGPFDVQHGCCDCTCVCGMQETGRPVM